MTSQPKRCSSMTTSLPSSPEPNNITRVADGDSGVPNVVTGMLGSKTGSQYRTSTVTYALRAVSGLIRLRASLDQRTLMRLRPLSLVGTLATAMTVTVAWAAEDAKPTWDVNSPPGERREIPIDVRSGTWMSVDVSPDGSHLAFDLLGDIYE